MGKVQGASFRVQAQADHTPISAIEIIKGWLENGELQEKVVQVWHDNEGAADLCVEWQDADFDALEAAFWYARVLETPTPRWSAYQCQREGRCDDYPEAHSWIRERAWTSPVWHLPEKP